MCVCKFVCVVVCVSVKQDAAARQAICLCVAFVRASESENGAERRGRRGIAFERERGREKKRGVEHLREGGALMA